MKTYKTVNGTSYDERTPDEVIAVLENARQSRQRLHISLGETDNERGRLGQDWLEEFETHGYVGRSMGPVKVPLLIANRRSTGGGAILDRCVIRIRTSAGGRVLYQNPKYHHGTLTIRQKTEPVTLPDHRVLTVAVYRDDQEHAAFETTKQAVRWARKLGVVARIALWAQE